MAQHKQELNPNVSADCVIFGFDFEKLNVLIIRRSTDATNKATRMALPGDLIYDTENLDMAASRILKELTGLTNIFMEQVAAFGDPDRIKTPQDQKWLKSIRTQPNARVITVGYYSLVKMEDCSLHASSFAKSAEWIAVNEIEELAFDHMEILQAAFKKLKEKIRIQPIGFNLLPEKFTLGQLHKLYEAILDKQIDKRNFRRKILKLDILTSLDEKQKGVAHKPSKFVKFNERKYNKLTETGFDNFSF
ncbi:MAG TPA: NUDIX domain-containing protein [Chitinophagaceae bacterium]|nr:NUDIX domain-containing protein [Chitinophagaceae bacterium]